MALSRLLVPKSSLPICIKRFSTRRVNFCSSFCSTSNNDRTPQLKKDAAAEGNREIAVQPLVNESPQTKPDIISKTSLARKEREAPWYNLKDVVYIQKDKMFGKDQPQNNNAIDASKPADCTALVVITSSDVPVYGSGEPQDSEATTKLQNDMIFSDHEVNMNHGKSCVPGEVYDDEVNGTTSEVNQLLNFPQAAETEDKDVFITKRMCLSLGISSLSSGENYCEEAARLNNSKLVSEEAEFLKSDDVSSPIFSDLEVKLVSNPENSSSLQPPTIILNSIECVKLEETKMTIGDLSVDLGSERVAFSALFDGSEKSTSLADLFQKNTHDQTSSETNIRQTAPETLSDLLSEFERKRVSQFRHSSYADYLSAEAATSDSEDDRFWEIPHIGLETNLQDDKNLRSVGDQTSSPSNGTPNIFDLKDFDVKSVNDQITQFKHANEPYEVDAEKLSEIKDLIGFIKLQEGVPSTSTHDNRDTGRMTKNPSDSSSQRFIYNDWLTASDLTTKNSRLEKEKTSDIHSLGGKELKANIDSLNPTMKIDDEKLRNNVLSESFNLNSQNLIDSKRLNSTDFTSLKSIIGDEERVDLDFGSLGCTDLKSGMRIPNPTKNIDTEKLENTFLYSKESNDSRVVVRFLRKAATKDDIIRTFNRFGAISKFEILDVAVPWFKTAYVDFKTREGFRRAIDGSDILVRNGVVTVEPATLNEKVTVPVPVPNLIGDPDVPTLLIKNPSRTVKIKNLTRDIRLHHIEEALFFCESNVSGYFLGSTKSVGFIEFETEIGKERALAKHTINVLGKELTLLRIDAPRTTVVRVTYVDSMSLKDIISVCTSFGKVRFPVQRCPGIFDVHYKIAEWPNMLNILNSLNSVKIEGTRLRAEPAPIFPPDILSALWHQPIERKYVKNSTLGLLKKLQKNTGDRAKLDSLEQFFEDSV